MKNNLKTTEQKSSKFPPVSVTVIIFVLMLILPLTFFFLLDQQTGDDFGLKDILFSVAFAIIITLFFIWIRILMSNRPYLGVILTLISIIVLGYGLFLRFKGFFTTIFFSIAVAIMLIYVGIYFYKYRHRDERARDDFEDVSTD